MDGGKLREAATKKDDQSILIQISNKDIVPQLVYHRPKLGTRSDIVYSECLSKGSVAESFIGDMVTSQSLQESDNALDTDGDGYESRDDTEIATLEEMYAVGLTLQNLHDHSSPGMKTGHHLHQISMLIMLRNW